MDQRVSRTTAGFTLIELMVGVTILSLLTLSVTLGINRPRTAATQDLARFQVLHDRLRDRAVLSGEVLGLALDAEGYQMQRREGGVWVPVGDAGFWRGAVVVQVPLEGRGPLIFTPAGQTSAVRLRFDTDAGPRLCVADGWEPVSCSGG